MLTIPEKDSNSRHLQRLIFVISGVALTALVVWFIARQLFAEQPSELQLAAVERGSVTQTLAVFGRLTPRASNSLVAQVDGHVSELNVLPGAEVDANTAIITLSNPQLLRQLQIAKLNWQKAQAKHVSALAKLQREATQLQNDVAMAASELKFAEQEIETLSKLHKTKLLSELDFLRAKTRLEQLRLQLDLTKRSEAAFQNTLEYEKQALALELESEKQQLAMTQDDVNNLQVTTSQSGILTELLADIEIGQAVSKGTVLAKLSSQNSLFAQLLAPASAIDILSAGMAVNIGIKGKTYAAQVVRVHPNVEANQIKFEATFTEHIPSSAVNNLSVSAEVMLASKDNTLRVAKPLYLKAGAERQVLYVFDGDEVQEKQVKIGMQGSEFIEVLAGVEIGEQVLKALPQSRSAIKL